MIDPPGAEGPDRVACMVERQFKHRQAASGEPAEPVVELLLHGRARCFGQLPRAKVGIARSRVRCRADAQLLGVQLAQVLADDTPRPTVAHHMVGRQHQNVIERRHAVKRGPEQRTRFQCERRADGQRASLGERTLLLGRIEPTQVVLDEVVQASFADHHLQAVARQSRAQRLMALDQPVDGCGQRIGVKCATHSQHHRLVVRQRCLRAQLVTQPDLALRFSGGDDELYRPERERIQVGVRGVVGGVI